MADDNLERQEVDSLIRELSAPPRKPAPKQGNQPAGGSTPPSGSTPPGGSTSTRSSFSVPRRRRFVSAISLAPALSSFSLPHFELPRFDMAPRRKETAVRLFVGLGALLGLAMPYWPYPKACAWWLLF